jgi:hypothetical protein
MNNLSTEEETLTSQEYISIAVVCLISAMFFSSIFFSWQSAIKTNALEQNVVQPLSQAARASTIEVAKTEIKNSLDYIEKTPRLNAYISGEDANWQDWYRNLDRHLETLQVIEKGTNQEQRILALLQTNRILLQGDKIFIPDDIEAQNDSNISSSLIVGCFICLVVFVIAKANELL